MEPNRQDRGKDKESKGKRPKGNLFLLILISVVVVIIISSIYTAINKSKYTETT